MSSILSTGFCSSNYDQFLVKGNWVFGCCVWAPGLCPKDVSWQILSQAPVKMTIRFLEFELWSVLCQRLCRSAKAEIHPRVSLSPMRAKNLGGSNVKVILTLILTLLSKLSWLHVYFNRDAWYPGHFTDLRCPLHPDNHSYSLPTAIQQWPSAAPCFINHWHGATKQCGSALRCCTFTCLRLSVHGMSTRLLFIASCSAQ